MKTIRSISLALVLLLTPALAAAHTGVLDDKTPTIRQELKTLLSGPNFGVEKNTTAFVELMVNANNELVVISVVTDNEELEYFVKDRLNYYKLKNKMSNGTKLTLPVTITASK